jgi:mRNA-degrading endonuclease RelE of RelBE toxin-antitoxin system
VTEGDDAYEVEWTPAALRALHRLPEKVAAAAIDFIYTTLATHPRRVGRPLRLKLEGFRSARRGDYRVIYRITDEAHTIVIGTIGHRSDVYRPR